MDKNEKDLPAQKLLIDIKFGSKKTYFAFHEEFLDIISKYYSDKMEDLDVSDDAPNKRICISEKLVKKSDSFLIDTTPTLNKSSSESTPRYTSFGKTILSNTKVEEEEKVTSANKCFNCDKATHSLRDCPEPRNLNKIRKARNDFSRKESRYHDDSEELNMIPGLLSSELQVALGITDNQIPLHVYKMRKFGYPPAWLEEAKVYCCTLDVNDSSDKLEFEQEASGKDFKYDIQKVFDFPGFNTPPTFAPFVDKCRILNLPPMLSCHSKEKFIASLGNFVSNGYKRKKLTKTNPQDESAVNLDDVEMEVEDDLTEQNDLVNDFDNRSDPEDGELSCHSSGSLLNEEELQRARSKLLNEISEINQSDSNNQVIAESNSQQKPHDTEQHGKVETTIFGCPLLPSFSSFDKLPSGDKFQEGVCDVIAFENLAESTGKYEKMVGLLKKVREYAKENQKE